MAADFRPPIDDIAFVLEHIAGLPEIASFPGLEHADLDTTVGLLREAGRFVAEVIAPLNVVGDTVGARRNADGTVTTAPGFAGAYRQYVEAGWGGISFPASIGGGGFPWVVTIAVQELISAANMGFSLCPLLTQGSIDLLMHHADEVQRETYLPKLVTGEWSGTMNLTEPDAGSDVGALRTRAVPAGDGTYRISGTKIYITYGEQDLTDNIVHLVLARTPGAPAGTKGISVFIVPKVLVGADGTLGERNRVQCLKIEHKAGIHASPTCVMEFDEAVGYLIGDEGTGMRSMFTMMNNARLSVGLEGLALSERAYQLAFDYAHDRRQGKAPGASGHDPSPIVDHPDVQLMLARMRAGVEAMRALLYLDASCVDRATHHPDPAGRAAAADLLALLTPIVKAFCTDLGIELTSLGIQVHGGMGYVEETGAAQHWRDSRIAPIYEGTNGIQAIDLVTRKLGLGGGAVVAELLARVEAEAGATDALAALRRSAEWLGGALATGRVTDALAGATPFLRQFGLVLCDWMLQRMAAVAGAPASKALVAEVWRTRFLPEAVGLEVAVTAGASAPAALFAR
jgi:alkylation response protein AidB-like acyl-CoA dehydrogenase